MPISDIHMNALGIVHGGSICTLIDTCAGYAAWAHKPEKVFFAVLFDLLSLLFCLFVVFLSTSMLI
jgi:acyl-coenzyme A thioesterase PaaI-like protein